MINENRKFIHSHRDLELDAVSFLIGKDINNILMDISEAMNRIPNLPDEQKDFIIELCHYLTEWHYLIHWIVKFPIIDETVRGRVAV